MATIAPKREVSNALGRRRLLAALRAFRRGDFDVRLPLDLPGVDGEIAEAFNDCIELNASLGRELERVSTVVGREGRIAQRASLGAVGGGWLGYVSSVNALIADLTQPMAEAGRVLGAVAKGDLSQSMALEIQGRPLKGQFLRSSELINTMVDQLNAFASEVTRVAREVGSEGKLGGQAVVKGVAGTWKDLTDSVNTMAGNLTNQVRNIADVTTAVANGDLSKKITVEARGEILELKGTINTMVDQLIRHRCQRARGECGAERGRGARRPAAIQSRLAVSRSQSLSQQLDSLGISLPRAQREPRLDAARRRLSPVFRRSGDLPAHAVDRPSF